MSGLPFGLNASITRPANATQYALKDVVNGSAAAPLELPFSITHHKIGFWIMNPTLISNNAAAVSGSFKLLLFRRPPNTPVDNAVFAPASGDIPSLLGMIIFDNAIKISNGTLYFPGSFSPIWGTLASGYDRIFGVLLDDSTYTPVSGETFTVNLAGQWDQ